jgi:hypothetical protein
MPNKNNEKKSLSIILRLRMDCNQPPKFLSSHLFNYVFLFSSTMFYVLLLGGTIYNIPSFYEGPFELFFYGGVLTNYNNPTPPQPRPPSPPAWL